MTRYDYAEKLILQQMEIDALRAKLKECMEIIERGVSREYPPIKEGIAGAYDPTFPPPSIL